VGHVQSLSVQPTWLALVGPYANRQLIVTGRYADSRERDLTPIANYTAAKPAIVEVSPGGLVQPRGNGKSVLLVQAGGQTVRLPVQVEQFDVREQVSFRRDVIAVLNVAGCNAGACHGTPSGKNGFKLSLRGFDPGTDYVTLTRDLSGRRIDRNQPEASLILQKGAGKVPHEGGVRLAAGRVPTRLLQHWLASGAPDDPAGLPVLRGLEVWPGSRVLAALAGQPAGSLKQQLAVVAHFADASERDVTPLTVFRSSDETVARVSSEGLVEFLKSGEVAILVRYLEEMVSVRLTCVQPAADYFWPNPPVNNYVDEDLFAKMKLLAIPPAPKCNDSDFFRRVYLDLCGILPAATEVQRFLVDNAPDKRARLVDGLFERPEYADFWALKWADVLNNNRRAVQAKGAYLLHQWLRIQFAQNTPFDEIARSLVTASGSTYLNPAANYFRSDRKVRDPEDQAQNSAQQFLGIRMSCARCHNHPFERWTQDDYYGLTAFFARVQDRPDPLHPRVGRFNQGALDIFVDRSGEAIHLRTGKPMPARLLGGDTATVKPEQDRREVLADWLTRPDNPFFARSVVNRIWYHLLGRGIVDPVDDFRDSNPAASEELLNALARDFVAHRFDTRHVIRTIMSSQIYQLGTKTNAYNRDDVRFFSHAVAKMHSAEVLLDALLAATEVPEVFPGMPAGTRATQLPDGDVFHHPFMRAFGQPTRETACECERSCDTSLGHALQLINGPTVKAKLTAPQNRIGRLLAEKRSDSEIVTELYLATLSRLPVDREREASLRHIGSSSERRRALEDIQWALFNSREFLLRH
jgi:hypothetical protein